MFGHDYRNRFDTDKLQNNVLMTQIRAEKKVYSSKNTQPIQSHRDQLQSHRNGKKVFHEILNRPSLSPSAKQNRGFNSTQWVRGRRMVMETANAPQERSRSGKRPMDRSYKREMEMRSSLEKEHKIGRRRLDHSPSHQHFNTTINLKWN